MDCIDDSLANVDICNKNGSTALMIVCEFHPDYAHLLIKAGANVNTVNIDGWNALGLACRYNLQQLIPLLIKNGALPIGITKNDILDVPSGSSIYDIYNEFVTDKPISILQSICDSIIDPNDITLTSHRRILGKGAFGIVKQGVYKNQDVAIKYFFMMQDLELYGLDEDQATFQKVKNDIIKEMLVSRSILHPNILFCHGMVFDLYTPISLIMEYGETTLENCIGLCGLDKLMGYSIHYLNGIQCLHENSIIHRDIKPDNVIIVNDVAKISDFGLSKKLLSSMNTPLKGTAIYCAPEILSLKHYKYEADVYSVGVSLIQTIINELPVVKHGNMEHLNDVHQVLGDCSLFKMIELSIQVDSELRPSIEDIIKSIEFYLEDKN
eukprot:TRINITY_DN6665_c0_g1_i1.p1 TRINITY_DN6665_c0_g1~~TRINITY_DN6665_c0_g1_i1.p1  ORF type:complete len:381 (+),score=69.18 TRINITY_DN6665_c0_g1_i1:903-2045(+)